MEIVRSSNAVRMDHSIGIRPRTSGIRQTLIAFSSREE